MSFIFQGAKAEKPSTDQSTDQRTDVPSLLACKIVIHSGGGNIKTKKGKANFYEYDSNKTCKYFEIYTLPSVTINSCLFVHTVTRVR